MRYCFADLGSVRQWAAVLLALLAAVACESRPENLPAVSAPTASAIPATVTVAPTVPAGGKRRASGNRARLYEG